MEFKWHLLIGFVASSILINFFDFTLLAGLIVFLSSWLIDGDHYFWYAIEMKDWSPKNAVRWYVKSIPKWFSLPIEKRNEFRRGVFICHGVLFWAILAILSIFYKMFLWILIGVAIHIVVDWVNLYTEGEPLYNKILPCYVIRRNKNKKSLKLL